MILLITILTLLMILDAVGDGYRAIGRQKIHHVIEAVQIALWFVLIYFARDIMAVDLIWMAVYYISIRIVFFDGIFNKVIDKSWDYSGNSSFWDELHPRIKNTLRLISYAGLVISFVMLMSN